MGLTNWKGGRIRKEDIAVAKNYLTEEELQGLNLIVSAYLDLAELQAFSRRPMSMSGWVARLDDFLKLTERDILTHAGKVTHDAAVEKAAREYERFRTTEDQKPSLVDKHFDEAVRKAKALESGKPTRKPRKSGPLSSRSS